jgi:hypothetical protein
MRKSLRIVVALPVLFLFLGCAQNVFANSVTFDFTIGGAGISASGTFTATFLSGNVYLVTSITGMQNGASMTLLAPFTYGGNSNQITMFITTRAGLLIGNVTVEAVLAAWRGRAFRYSFR